ncbi:MAG TPA: hypothetical protein VEX35_04340 [Allosphingosinicella sp.]|nr:hypothetical protein [Allosphingosinicella sp.]
MKSWIALALALTSLALAATFLSVVPASECGTPQLPRLLLAAIPAAVYALAGGYVVWKGERDLRLALFAVSLLIAAGYVAVLRETLPIVVQGEISCARHGGR